MGTKEQQISAIEEMCKRLSLDPEGLADGAGINQETMRKYANGYQNMPDWAWNTLRLFEENRRLHGQLLREDSSRKEPSSAAWASNLETDTLQKNLSELAGKLARVAAVDRKYILGNIRAILDELEERDLRGASSTVEDAAQRGLKVAAGVVEHPGVIYGRSGKAALTSGKTSLPGASGRKRQDTPPVPPKPVQK